MELEGTKYEAESPSNKSPVLLPSVESRSDCIIYPYCNYKFVANSVNGWQIRGKVRIGQARIVALMEGDAVRIFFAGMAVSFASSTFTDTGTHSC